MMTATMHSRLTGLGVGLALLLLVTWLVPACSQRGEADVEHAETSEGTREADPIAVAVRLTEAAARTAGIRVETARSAEGEVAGGFSAPGQVEFDPARVAIVSPRTSGRIERLAAVEGDRVAAGEAVAFLLSPAFLTAQNDYAQAVRRAQLLAGSRDEQGGRALAAAARQRLQLLGAPLSAIKGAEEAQPPLDLLPVTTPFAGSIVETLALAGSGVEAGTPIFRIADLSVVNVVADIPERLLAGLRRGQAAVVRIAAYPDLELPGRVARIREMLDPATRTAKAVIVVANPGRKLRPGMFGTVELKGLAAPAGAAAAPAVTIPESALVTDGAQRLVFVETGPWTYERRQVQVAAFKGGRVIVSGGLAAGERVVVAGAFTLKSELGKGEFGEEE